MNDNILNFKIDTKEKMHVITVEKQELAANMTEKYRKELLPFLEKPVKNLVLNFVNVHRIDAGFAQEMVNIQQTFYDKGASMVICHLSRDMQNFLDDQEVLDILNITPTESEAWDIVQMEEIERELL